MSSASTPGRKAHKTTTMAGRLASLGSKSKYSFSRSHNKSSDLNPRSDLHNGDVSPEDSRVASNSDDYDGLGDTTKERLSSSPTGQHFSTPKTRNCLAIDQRIVDDIPLCPDINDAAQNQTTDATSDETRIVTKAKVSTTTMLDESKKIRLTVPPYRVPTTRMHSIRRQLHLRGKTARWRFSLTHSEPELQLSHLDLPLLPTQVVNTLNGNILSKESLDVVEHSTGTEHVDLSHRQTDGSGSLPDDYDHYFEEDSAQFYSQEDADSVSTDPPSSSDLNPPEQSDMPPAAVSSLKKTISKQLLSSLYKRSSSHLTSTTAPPMISTARITRNTQEALSPLYVDHTHHQNQHQTRPITFTPSNTPVSSHHTSDSALHLTSIFFYDPVHQPTSPPTPTLLQDTDSFVTGNDINKIEPVKGFTRCKTIATANRRSRRRNSDKEYRVKPFHVYAEGVYMTESEIYKETVRASEHFELLRSSTMSSTPKFTPPVSPANDRRTTSDSTLHAATNRSVCLSQAWNNPNDGRIGSLTVEVLRAIGLPKFDRFSKPNIITYLICGDVPFITDIISSTVSPMWPARSKRAAIFPIFHAYARLFVGVFGADDKKENENDDFCGRTMVEIAVLRPNSAYDVTLPLRSSSFVYDRKPRGAIRLRFSLHWFQERSAVLSYIRPKPRSMEDNTYNHSSAKKWRSAGPSISCADAKTFRNVAITVHGEDLPGKYSRRAFRATMREAALYHMQIRFLCRNFFNDIMMYEKPVISFFVFVGWMHCVYSNSVSMVPPYLVGSLICVFMNNCATFSLDPSCHYGYAPLSVWELVCTLIFGTGESGRNVRNTMRPLMVKNQPLKLRCSSEHLSNNDNEANEDEFDLVDHMEFPFSEKIRYKRISIEDSLVPRSRSQSTVEKSCEKKLSRLSINIPDPAIQVVDVIANVPETGDDEWDHDEINSDVNSDPAEEESIESEDDSDSYLNEEDSVASPANGFLFSRLKPTRNIPPGPEQIVDILPKKRVPFRHHLIQLENRLHIWSGHLFKDKICGPSSQSLEEVAPDGETNEQLQSLGTQQRKKQKKRTLDEFERRLGLNKKYSNPVVALTAGYLEPVMNMVRVYLLTVRVIFNIGSWKDPYLSFWVLCFLVLLMVVLIIFPWRPFLLLTGLIFLGPQNLILRCTMKDSAENVVLEENGAPSSQHDINGSMKLAVEPKVVSTKRQKLNMAKLRFHRRGKKGDIVDSQQFNSTETNSDRTEETGSKNQTVAFSARSTKISQKVTRKHLVPRDVIVPYSRLRRDRFFYWPPDPTVSRATPLTIEDLSTTGQYESRIFYHDPIPLSQPIQSHESDAASKMRFKKRAMTT